MMAGPVVYTLDEIKVRDTIFEVRMGDTLAWGYGDDPRSAAADRIRTDEVGDIVITINVGDSLVFPDGLTTSSGNSETHYFTIDALSVDLPAAPNEDIEPGFIIAPAEAGAYRLYCSAHPDAHGSVFIVVL